MLTTYFASLVPFSPHILGRPSAALASPGHLVYGRPHLLAYLSCIKWDLLLVGMTARGYIGALYKSFF